MISSAFSFIKFLLHMKRWIPKAVIWLSWKLIWLPNFIEMYLVSFFVHSGTSFVFRTFLEKKFCRSFTITETSITRLHCRNMCMIIKFYDAFKFHQCVTDVHKLHLIQPHSITFIFEKTFIAIRFLLSKKIKGKETKRNEKPQKCFAKVSSKSYDLCRISSAQSPHFLNN